MVIPDGLTLRPVRRLGSFRGATSKLGMYPVVRDGRVLFLCAESRLEMGWFRTLDIDPRVTWMHAQPFVMYWRLGDKAVYHIPDLLVICDGCPVVCDVKPHDHVERDPYARMIMDLTAATLQVVDIRYRWLGDITPQAAQNLKTVTRYKRANPDLIGQAAMVTEARPTSASGVFSLCEDVRDGYEVLMHLLATGRCVTDLNRAFDRATSLDWPDPR